MKPLAAAALAFPSLLATLRAQDRGPDAWLPREACVVAQVNSRLELGRRFGPTKLGAVLGDQALQEACGRSWKAAQSIWGEELGEAPRRLLAACAAFPGRITFGLGSRRGEAGPALRAALVLDDCPAASLESMRKAIDECLPDVDGPGPLTLGERKFRVWVTEHRGAWLTRPEILEHRLVLLGGTGLASLDAWSSVPAAQQRAAPRLPVPSAPIALRLDGQRLTELLEALRARPTRSPDDAVVVERVTGALGLRSIASVELNVAPAADRVHFDLDLRFASGQPTGIFRIFGPTQHAAAPAVPAIVQLVPPGHAVWDAMRLDLALVPQIVRDAWTSLGAQAPVTYADAAAKVTALLKIDVEAEIFARLGDEVLVLQNVVDELPEELETGDFVKDAQRGYRWGNCYVVKIRDGEPFAQALDKAVRARGLHAGRKSEDVAGTRVHRVTLAGNLPVSYAVTPDHFLVALGEEAAKDLRAVLAHVRTAGPASRPRPLPEGLAREIERMPVAVTGVGVQRVVDVADTLAATMEAIVASEAAELAELLTDLKAPFAELPKALRRAQVENGYSLSGVGKDRLFWRDIQ